jgi:hypothetical protein
MMACSFDSSDCDVTALRLQLGRQNIMSPDRNRSIQSTQCASALPTRLPGSDCAVSLSIFCALCPSVFSVVNQFPDEYPPIIHA